MYTLDDVLIHPGNEEERFVKKHHIELHRLNNGIIILGIPWLIKGSVWSHIEWEFLEGAYGNPAGTVHFFEHFINKKIDQIASRNSLKYNAFTSQIKIGGHVSGIINPKVLDYGVWTVLPGIVEALKNPFSTVDDPISAIGTEKLVIKAEIQRREADHHFHTGKHFRKVMYAPDNPLTDYPSVPGTLSDLEKITLPSLEKVYKNVLIPKQLFIEFHTEGELSLASFVNKKLISLLSDFPRGNVKKAKWDDEILGHLSNAKSGETFKYDTGLKNKVVTYEFLWVLESHFPNVEYFALNELIDALSSELFTYSRKKGWAYHTAAFINRPNKKKAILSLRVECSNKDQNNFLPGLREVISSIPKISPSLCEIERKRQKAKPPIVTDRLYWMSDGIEDYGMMVDIEKIRKIIAQITPKNINDLAAQLLSVEPIVLITGDLT